MNFSRRTALGLALGASAFSAPGATARPASLGGRQPSGSDRQRACDGGALNWAAQKRRHRVLGREMAYIDKGRGRPIVFLHGNPTSSYLWRRIIPYAQPFGRCIAPDLIGMGDSDKLPDSGPMRYAFAEHQRYLYGLLDALDLGDDITLVVHDWGSALGLSWAMQNPHRVRAIAYMEAIIESPGSPEPADPPGSFFDHLRSPGGEQLVLVENGWIERLVSDLRLYLTPEDVAEYRRPFLIPGEGRRPTLDWPRQMPLDAEPRNIYEAVRTYSDWLVRDAGMSKLFIRAEPGALINRPEKIAFLREARRQTEVRVWGPHFVQEISPDAIGRALAAWLPTT